MLHAGKTVHNDAKNRDEDSGVIWKWSLKKGGKLRLETPGLSPEVCEMGKGDTSLLAADTICYVAEPSKKNKKSAANNFELAVCHLWNNVYYIVQRKSNPADERKLCNLSLRLIMCTTVLLWIRFLFWCSGSSFLCAEQIYNIFVKCDYEKISLTQLTSAAPCCQRVFSARIFLFCFCSFFVPYLNTAPSIFKLRSYLKLRSTDNYLVPLLTYWTVV